MAIKNDSWATAIEIAASLCIRFEGVYLRPYKCPAGVWTVGIGATFYESGVPVSQNDPPISRDRAVSLLHLQLQSVFLPAVLRMCPALDKCPKKLAAILDFTFNTGPGRLQTSTLRRCINAQDWTGAVEQLNKWIRGGGKVLPGLVARRAAESQLIR
jgi:lysozyme